MPSEVPSIEENTDFPPGPLSSFRKRASFSWRKMQVFLETEDIVQYKVSIFKREYFSLNTSFLL